MSEAPLFPLVKDIADVEAIEAVPLEARSLPASTYDIIVNAQALHPDRDAIVYISDARSHQSVERTTYKSLHEGVAQAARLFEAHGVTRRDVVSILLPNLPQFHFAFWGAEAVGIANPINPLQTAEAIVDLLRAAKTKVLVALSPALDSDVGTKVAAIAASGLDLVIYTVGAPTDDFDDFDTARLKHSNAILSNRPKPTDIAALFQTGGTTGRPKLAKHTHANEVFMAWTLASSLALSPESTLLCGLPLFHVNGVFVTGLAPFSRGAKVVLATTQGYRNRDLLANFWHVVEHHRVTHFSAVPTIVSTLMDIPVGEADVSSLAFVLCGAAPLPASLLGRFEAAFDLTILEGYGLTEGACASALNPPLGVRLPGAVGLRIPYQQVEIRHGDEKGQYTRKCGMDESGAIFIRGPNVFAGYVDPIANAGVLYDDGWLNTGDLGRLDDEGYLWLSGRSKDLIIRGGHNIDPEVIEEGLCQHPAVAQAAAIGLPDPRLGELPAVFVSLRDGAQVSVAELVEHCVGAISERAARPVRIEIVDAMPLTAVGKIFKPELRRRLTEFTMRGQLRQSGIEGDLRVELSDRYGLHVWLWTAHESDRDAALSAISDFPFRIDVIGERPAIADLS